MRRNLVIPLVLIVAIAFGSLALTIAAGNEPELGLDLQGGASVVLSPPAGVPGDVLDQAIEIIRNRVDALGVAEPEITRQGDAVIVELPGVKDQQRALEIVGQTAELRFRPVLEVLPPEGAETTTTTSTTSTTAPAETTTTAPGETTTTSTTSTTAVPASTETTPPEQNTAEAIVVLPGLDSAETAGVRYRLGPAGARGDAVKGAGASIIGVSGEWAVDLEFTGDGIDQFNALAAQCFNREPTCPTGQIAIELDGVVQSAPTVQQPSFGSGDVQITGNFNESEAKQLALVLRFGALPVQLEPQNVQTVSPSLGKDSLRAGLIAGAIGTALVLLYILVYYRLLGVVVILGLLVWGALQWSIISYLGVQRGLALSLAGVTGLVVSIGVTVDSYVVYFERLRDEVRSGKSVRSSVDRGFQRAFRTILAADTSAFIGAFLLYVLTVGPVRGFAFFLGLSTVLDVIVAWFFTRPLVALLSRRPAFRSPKFLGLTRAVEVQTRAATT
jgi:preprotein translocase subunit SecD